MQSERTRAASCDGTKNENRQCCPDTKRNNTWTINNLIKESDRLSLLELIKQTVFLCNWPVQEAGIANVLICQDMGDCGSILGSQRAASRKVKLGST